MGHKIKPGGWPTPEPGEACPFCGKYDLVMQYGPNKHWIECNWCAARGPTDDTMELAVDAWNERRDFNDASREETQDN